LSDSSSELVRLATEARDLAYAPYSRYQVGAALQSSNGRIFTGSNVENISYGLTICAERSAIAAMVSAGERVWAEIAVVTEDAGTPCGMCLQTLAEFCDDADTAQIRVCDLNGGSEVFTLKQLLPRGFSANAVRRTEQDQ